jgi:hypothetical protein
MLGPEVRRCYEEGVGFITAVGVHHDVTGNARARVLAVAKAIGGLRQGAVELKPRASGETVTVPIASAAETIEERVRRMLAGTQFPLPMGEG